MSDARSLYHDALPGPGRADARTLLVMHGGLGWDHSYLRPALDALGAHARVVYYDHRGNGRSAPPDDWGAVTHATWADDAVALIDHLGLDRVVLFGHSYGGFLALEAALRHADRLDGLILCSTAPDPAYFGATMAAVEAAHPEAAAVLAAVARAEPLAGADAFAAGVRTLAPVYTRDPAVAERAVERVRWNSDALIHAFGRCLPAYDVSARLHEIRTPTLVLAGRHDVIPHPAHGAERLHAALPHSELVLFEHSAHLPFAEEPEAFTAAVADWLARLP